MTHADPSLLAIAPPLPDEVATLVEQSAKGNDALMRGDVVDWEARIPMAADFTLMSPFGGEPTRGAPSPARREQIARFFKNGSLRQEVVQTYRTADMIVLAVIERAHVEVGEAPAQDWALRVTLVYRRDGSRWLLVHRHADPLGHAITVDQAAALGRGASPSP